MTLTKDDLTKAVYLKIIGNQHDLARRSDATNVVEEVFETIKQTLESGEKVKILDLAFSPRGIKKLDPVAIPKLANQL